MGAGLARGGHRLGSLAAHPAPRRSPARPQGGWWLRAEPAAEARRAGGGGALLPGRRGRWRARAVCGDHPGRQRCRAGHHQRPEQLPVSEVSPPADRARSVCVEEGGACGSGGGVAGPSTTPLAPRSPTHPPTAPPPTHPSTQRPLQRRPHLPPYPHLVPESPPSHRRAAVHHLRPVPEPLPRHHSPPGRHPRPLTHPGICRAGREWLGGCGEWTGRARSRSQSFSVLGSPPTPTHPPDTLTPHLPPTTPTHPHPTHARSCSPTRRLPCLLSWTTRVN